MFLLLSAKYLSPRWGWVNGALAFLYTFRPSGAFKGWCAVRTLQMYFIKQALMRTRFFAIEMRATD